LIDAAWYYSWRVCIRICTPDIVTVEYSPRQRVKKYNFSGDGMSVCLLSDSNGDPRDPFPSTEDNPRGVRVKEKLREIEDTQGFIPPATRESLRKIIKKSHDPRKSLAYFRSKFNEFLNKDLKKEHPETKSTQSQMGSIKTLALAPERTGGAAIAAVGAPNISLLVG
jgi:hypothetical protein